VIRDASERHGALLVDLYTGAPELADNPDYVSADGFHPSSAGYQRIAELVLATLQQHNAALVSS
jgi:lysophospholipase L1-like esterase